MTSSAPMPTTLPEVAQLAVQNREDIASLIRLVGQVNHSVQQLAQHQAASHDRLAGQVNDIAQQLAQHQTGAYDRLVSAITDLLRQDRENIAALIAGQERNNAAIAELTQGQAELVAGQERNNAAIAELIKEQAEQRNAIAELTQGQAELRATVAQLVAGQERTNRAIAELTQGQAELRATVAQLVAGQERNTAAIAELTKEQAEQRTAIAELRAAIAELTKEQAEQRNAVAELRATVAELAETVRELVRSQQTMRTELATVSGRLANITGTRYEKHAAQSTPRRVRRLFGLRDVTIAHTDWEPGRLMISIRDSDLISDDEADDVGHIDILLTGHDAADDVVLIAAEISTTIQDGDVTRAHHRAELIARASGRNVHPAVIGQSAEDYALAMADLRRVAVITVPPPVPD